MKTKLVKCVASDFGSDWSEYNKSLEDGYKVVHVASKKVIYESLEYEVLMEKP